MRYQSERIRKRKMAELRRDNRGTTLVEMIVSFVLISLFMVAASRVISNTVIIYYQAKGISTGMQVSNIISSKIVGVVEGAMFSTPLTDDSGSGTTAHMLLKKDGIELTDRAGNHALVRAVNPDDNTATDGKPHYMEIEYFPAMSAEDDDDPTSAGVEKPRTIWAFDPKTYMGYSVKELRFEQAGNQYRDNILKMTLVLTSPQYGDYSTESYIECYNYREESGSSIKSVAAP